MNYDSETFQKIAEAINEITGDDRIGMILISSIDENNERIDHNFNSIFPGFQTAQVIGNFASQLIEVAEVDNTEAPVVE